jgi:hypothetical protein
MRLDVSLCELFGVTPDNGTEGQRDVSGPHAGPNRRCACCICSGNTANAVCDLVYKLRIPSVCIVPFILWEG